MNCRILLDYCSLLSEKEKQTQINYFILTNYHTGVGHFWILKPFMVSQKITKKQQQTNEDKNKTESFLKNIWKFGVPFIYLRCAHTSTGASGHIISHVPCIIWCFGSFSLIHPPPSDLAGADQTPACVQLANMTPWLSSFEPQPSWGPVCHINVLQMALLLLSPSMPILLNALVRERAVKPQQPTSTLPSNQPADIHWPVPQTWRASSQMLLQGGLPMESLVIGWWLQCGWETSADV